MIRTRNSYVIKARKDVGETNTEGGEE
jgi:hypothetical protein